MQWVKKGAYIRQVDDATAEKLKAQGFVPFEPAKPKADKPAKAKKGEETNE